MKRLLAIILTTLTTLTGLSAAAQSDEFADIRAKASDLFNEYQWAEAEQYYHEYFANTIAGKGIEFQNICHLSNKADYGTTLHEYALSCLFQGKEDYGLDLLYLASECGDKTAANHYNILAEDLQSEESAPLSKKYIRQFEGYYDQFSFQYTGDDASEFWDNMVISNENLAKLQKALAKKKTPKPLAKALSSIQSSQSLITEMLETQCTPYALSDVEPNLRYQLFNEDEDEDPLEELRIYNNSAPNAFTTPYGQIYITDALVNLYSNNAMLLAICAHEATHYMCSHSLMQSWEYEQKLKRNRIASGIMIGLYATAVTAGVVSEISNDRYDPKWGAMADLVSLSSVFMCIALEADTFNFQFRYSRDQEIEADIMAYRYCEAIGLGGYVYITALELLGADFENMKAASTDDHPTTAYRVALLKYLYSKEH